MRTSALFAQKTSDFSKFIVCPHGQGGLSQYGHFTNKEGQFVAILSGRLYGLHLRIIISIGRIFTNRFTKYLFNFMFFELTLIYFIRTIL